MTDLTKLVKSIQNIMRGDAGVNGDAQRIEQTGWLLFLKVYDSCEETWELNEDNYTSIIPENLRWRNWAHDNSDGKSLTGDELLEFVNNELFPGLRNIEITSETPVKKSIVRDVFQDNNQYMKNGVLLRQLINEIDSIKLDNSEQKHALGDIYETFLQDLQSAGNAGEFYTPRPVTDFIVKMTAPKLGEKIADFAAGTCGFLVSALKSFMPLKTVRERELYGRSVYGIEKKGLPYLLGITNLLLHEVDEPKLFHTNSLERNVENFTESEKFDVILMNPPYGSKELDNIKANFPADMQSSETADLFCALASYRLRHNGRAAIILPDGFLFGTDNTKQAIKKRLLEKFNLHTIIRLPAGTFSPYTSITTNIIFFENSCSTQNIWFYRVPSLPDNRAYSKTKPFNSECFNECLDWWNDRHEIFDDEGQPVSVMKSAKDIQDANYNLDWCGYSAKGDYIPEPYEAFRELEESFNAMQDNMKKLKFLLENNNA